MQDEFDHEVDRDWVNKHFIIKVDAGSKLTHIRYVTAEAGTGYKYALTVTPLPLAGQQGEGGPMLVTILRPWVDAWALQSSGYLTEGYVAEHLCGSPTRQVSDGDLRAITLLVRHALNRPLG